ncbi:malonyl-[acyl-carrier protein] O-methyltransferase [bacterium BMS3Abin12]|nr:malonyl-[acyl-carrier protein] O-methyltransferase [bacterium BMS3Abin12]
MADRLRPRDYDAWYDTPRGAWIAAREFALLRRLTAPAAGATLLDVGCGTGRFSRRFAAAGFGVTGVDPDPAMLEYAAARGAGVRYVRADAGVLPFPFGAFDWVAAVTSLCFIADPARALREAWRVARTGVVLGLLNRASLLHRHKHGRGGYAGARWDRFADVRQWARGLQPQARLTARSAVFMPSGGPAARAIEVLAPARCLMGGFLAVVLTRVDVRAKIPTIG